MKPKHLIYCPDCGYKKQLFESESKAYRFLKYNGDEILRKNGKKPFRAYFCIACAGWHLTSKRKRDCLSNSERAIQNLENFEYMKIHHKPNPTAIQQIESAATHKTPANSLDIIEDSIAASRNFVKEQKFDKALQLINESWRSLDCYDVSDNQTELAKKELLTKEIKNVGKKLKNAGYEASAFSFDLEKLIEQEKENKGTAAQLQIEASEFGTYFSFKKEIIDLFDNEAYEECEEKIKWAVEHIIPEKDAEISQMTPVKLKKKYSGKMTEIKVRINKIRKQIPYQQAIIISNEIEEAIPNICDEASLHSCETMYSRLALLSEKLEMIKKGCLTSSFLEICNDVKFIKNRLRAELDKLHQEQAEADENTNSVIENEKQVKKLFLQGNYGQVIDILMNDAPLIARLKFNRFVGAILKNKIESIEIGYNKLVGNLQTQLTA